MLTQHLVEVELDDSVLGPLVLIGLRVHKEDHMRRLEDLLNTLVLGADDQTILQVLRHAIQVVRMVNVAPRDIEDDDGLAVIHVSHVCHLVRQHNSVVLQYQVSCLPTLASATFLVDDPNDPSVIRLLRQQLQNLLLPLLGLEPGVSELGPGLSLKGLQCAGPVARAGMRASTRFGRVAKRTFFGGPIRAGFSGAGI